MMKILIALSALVFTVMASAENSQFSKAENEALGVLFQKYDPVQKTTGQQIKARESESLPEFVWKVQTFDFVSKRPLRIGIVQTRARAEAGQDDGHENRGTFFVLQKTSGKWMSLFRYELDLEQDNFDLHTHSSELELIPQRIPVGGSKSLIGFRVKNNDGKTLDSQSLFLYVLNTQEPQAKPTRFVSMDFNLPENPKVQFREIEKLIEIKGRAFERVK